jgi:hypothetical protein
MDIHEDYTYSPERAFLRQSSRDDALGFAVMNRMMKAAGYNIIKV